MLCINKSKWGLSIGLRFSSLESGDIGGCSWAASMALLLSLLHCSQLYARQKIIQKTNILLFKFYTKMPWTRKGQFWNYFSLLEICVVTCLIILITTANINKKELTFLPVTTWISLFSQKRKKKTFRINKLKLT